MASQKRQRGAVGGAVAEPVTLAEAKTHLRVDHSNDDSYIDSLIIAATDYTELITGRSLIQGTFDFYLDSFHNLLDVDQLLIPSPPLISVTAIKYFDESDVEQTWSAVEYVVDTDQAYLAKIYPARNYAWPSTRIFPKSVHIEYIAGYESGTSPVTGDAVPMSLKQAMLLLIGHLYENREMTTAGIQVRDVPMAYDALIAPYKVMRF